MKLFDGEWFGFYDKLGEKICVGDTLMSLLESEPWQVLYCQETGRFLMMNHFNMVKDFEHFDGDYWMIIGEGDD